MEESIRKALSAPFPSDAVKSRRGSFGKISYVEGNAVISRLNDCFGGDWSFSIVEHRELSATGEVLVHGRLTVLGQVTKEAFGRSSPPVSRETGEMLSQGDAFSAAATNSLKKAASMLGVALYLYTDDPAEQPEEKPARLAAKSTPASRASSKQVSAIWSLGRRLGLDANAIRSRCAAEHDAFPENLDRTQASAFITALADQVDANKGAA